MMTRLSVMTLFALLCVGLAHSVSDIEFELVLQHIDLLKSQVNLLKSRELFYKLKCLTIHKSLSYRTHC